MRHCVRYAGRRLVAIGGVKFGSEVGLEAVKAVEDALKLKYSNELLSS